MRILLISASYFPFNSPASHRVGSFARDLPRAGCTVDLAVPRFDEQTTRNGRYDPQVGQDFPEAPHAVAIHGNPYKKTILSRVFRRMRDHFSIAHELREPVLIYQAVRESARMLVDANQYDFIIATSPQVLALSVAREMAERTRTPWIADFRDIPTEFDRVGGKKDRKWRLLSSIRDLIAEAAGITVVSEAYLEHLKCQDKPVEVIYNGFDERLLRESGTSNNDGKFFSLFYCGTLAYGRDRSLAILFEAMDHLRKNGIKDADKIRVEIVGPESPSAKQLADGCACCEQIHFGGSVSYRESIARQHQSDVLLLLAHRNSAGIVPSKLFEYFAALRPILSIPSDEGKCDELIRETRSGRVGSTVEEVATILAEWLELWRKHGALETAQDRPTILKFSRQAQSQSLYKFLQLCQDQA